MNKLSLLTSATGVALLLAGVAPAFALAEESGAGSGVTNPATTVQTSGDGEQEHQGPLNPRIPKFMASSTERMNKKHELQQKHELERQQHASTSEVRMGKVQEKSGESIDKRIKSLQELSDRLAHMKLLPADTLATIQASLAAEIKNLTDLKAKIASGTDKDTIKADVQSISKEHRVFLLVEPKARIAAASSRINAVVTQLQLLSTKLQARITSAQTAGTDVTTATAALADLNAKAAEAKSLADAAVAQTAGLVADNGDKSVLAANLAALKDARTKISNAEKALAAARHDAATIKSVVQGKGEAKTTTTPNTESR